MATLHVCLVCPVAKSILLPPNSTIWPRKSLKMAQKVRNLCQTAPKRKTSHIPGYVVKSQLQGHLVHLQPPTFCDFQPSKLPNETPRPPYQWSLGGARGQRRPRTVGANNGSTRVPGAEKNHLLQSCS